MEIPKSYLSTRYSFALSPAGRPTWTGTDRRIDKKPGPEYIEVGLDHNQRLIQHASLCASGDEKSLSCSIYYSLVQHANRETRRLTNLASALQIYETR